MKKTMHKFSLLLAAAALCACMLVQPVLAAGGLDVSIPVGVSLSGFKPSQPEVFTLTLTPDSPEYPMPAGTQDGSAQLQITGEGNAAFGPIHVPHTGIYTYTVCQQAGNHPRGHYDPDIFQVTVTVTNKRSVDEGLQAVVAIHRQGEELKDDMVLFANHYDDPPAGDEAPPSVVPVSAPPKTGDESRIGTLIALILGSAVCLGIVLAVRRRDQ